MRAGARSTRSKPEHDVYLVFIDVKAKAYLSIASFDPQRQIASRYLTKRKRRQRSAICKKLRAIGSVAVKET